jgi:imidazole glycerol-phosphate synthase subunit HisH
MTTRNGPRVGIIDYGSGNLGSVASALENLGADVDLVTDPTRLKAYQTLLLPGVGNFTASMRDLAAGGWVDRLRECVSEERCFLIGICVGMQLLADRGDEGASDVPTEGMSFVRGHVRHLTSFGCNERIPHVGWNSIEHNESPLFRGIRSGTDFYFVHSYAMDVQEPSTLAGEVRYGGRIAAAVQSGRVFGTQFHPEKSGRAGLALLRNFLELAKW